MRARVAIACADIFTHHRRAVVAAGVVLPVTANMIHEETHGKCPQSTDQIRAIPEHISQHNMPSLSKAERAFIDGGAACGVRTDGRALLDIRPVTLETSLLPTASGSARVRIGGVTDIVVGVKAE
eukprot:IDg21003t1